MKTLKQRQTMDAVDLQLEIKKLLKKERLHNIFRIFSGNGIRKNEDGTIELSEEFYRWTKDPAQFLQDIQNHELVKWSWIGEPLSQDLAEIIEDFDIKYDYHYYDHNFDPDELPYFFWCKKLEKIAKNKSGAVTGRAAGVFGGIESNIKLSNEELTKLRKEYNNVYGVDSKEFKKYLRGFANFAGSEITLTLVEKMEMEEYSKKLKKMVDEKIRYGGSVSPQKRLNLSSIVRKKEDIYRKKNKEGYEEINIAVMLDMSGSMFGDYNKEALKLIWTLKESKAIRGDLIVAVDNKLWITDLKKIPDSFLFKLTNSNGGDERIGQNIKKYKNKILKNKDVVLALTDAQLCGTPVDKQLAEKYNVWGVYCNTDGNDNKSYKKNMSQYFSNYIVESNFDALLNKLVEKMTINLKK